MFGFKYTNNKMKAILKTYKLRLYPNKEQETLLNKTFGCTRFLYNILRYWRLDGVTPKIL